MKLALIGTGMIINDALLALQTIPQIELTAIFARPHSKDKADALSSKYNIAKVYTNYDEVLKDSEIDFVYIGLVNTAHYEYTKKALIAGKNVILEKPSCPTSKEIAELIQLARDKKLYLFEAVTLLHMPNFYAIKNLLPELGAIKLIQCNYSQLSSRYAKYKQGIIAPAFDPNFCGGALYDINIYNLNFVIGLFGEPLKANYLANRGANGIDTSGIATLTYENFAAVCTGAKDSNSPSFLIVQGENGFIRVNGAPNESKSFDVCINGNMEHKQLNQYDHRMIHEFIEFEQTYREQDYDRMSHDLDVSLAVIETVEKALA